MIRLFAIALLIYGVGRMEYIVNLATYSNSNLGPSTFFAITSSILPILISIILWFFPITVAGKILPFTEDKEIVTNSHTILTTLVLAIGVYTFYNAIVDSMFWVTYANVFVRDEFGNISKVLSNQDKANIIVTILEFILALVLLARAKTISSLLMKFTR